MAKWISKAVGSKTGNDMKKVGNLGTEREGNLMISEAQEPWIQKIKMQYILAKDRMDDVEEENKRRYKQKSADRINKTPVVGSSLKQ